MEAVLREGHQGTPYALVLIDHLIAAYGQQKGNDVLREQYQQLAPLRRLALKNKVTVMLLHHNRKAESKEFLDDPAGSVGVTAGAGALWVLRRDREADNYRQLYVIDRRTKEKMLRLELEASGFSVREEGAEAVTLGKQREVLALLRESGPPYQSKIARALGIDANYARQLLLRLRRKNFVVLTAGSTRSRRAFPPITRVTRMARQQIRPIKSRVPRGVAHYFRRRNGLVMSVAPDPGGRYAEKRNGKELLDLPTP